MGINDQQINELAQKDPLAEKWKAKEYFNREQPQHKIELKSYSISKHPVTVGEYGAFLEAAGYQKRTYWTKAGWLWRESTGKIQPEHWDNEKWTWCESLPVIGVSWYESVAYCTWLSEMDRKKYRLPTEAEWEKAARGTDIRLYPWGREFDANLCNTRARNLKQTVSVNEYTPGGESPYGCDDMAGNVSEWTLSEYQPYPYDGKDGRNDVEGEKLRVIRGGSWYKPKLRARVTTRGMNDPFFADTDVGFRYVCEE